MDEASVRVDQQSCCRGRSIDVVQITCGNNVRCHRQDRIAVRLGVMVGVVVLLLLLQMLLVGVKVIVSLDRHR